MSYQIKLNTTGLEFEGKGETVLDALLDMNIGWENIKSKGVITITHNKKKHEHLFTLTQLRRIFLSKGFMGIWAKRLEFLTTGEG